MKSLKFLLLLMVVPMFMASSDHKFYVSTTTIEHAPKEKTLQVITRIFLDDIEDALEARYQRKFTFNSKKETEADGKLLKIYVLDKLKISVNGRPATFSYIGKQYDIDMVKLYIEIPNVPKLNSIEIENKVLYDMFDEQQNIIHVKTADARRSLILKKENPKGLLNFSD